MNPAGADAALVAQIVQLRRYARALTGDRWEADDLVQDTLERAWDRWRTWKAGTDLRAWLFAVMHNLWIDQVRRALRRQQHEQAQADAAAGAHPVAAFSTDDAIDLQRYLMRLPDEQRETLLLVTLQDLAYEDVARITGVPIGTVMSRLSRARARMRELMESQEAETATAGTGPERPALRRIQ